MQTTTALQTTNQHDHPSPPPPQRQGESIVLTPTILAAQKKALLGWKLVQDHFQLTVGYAHECGAALTVVKSGLSYGNWSAWLEQEGIPARTARRYMQLASSLHVFQAVECGTIAEALRVISKKRDAPERSSATILPESQNDRVVTVLPESQNDRAVTVLPEPPHEEPPPKKTYGRLQKENAAFERDSILLAQERNVLRNELHAAKVRIEALELEGLQPSQQGARLTELKEEIKIHHAAANKWQQYHVDERRDRKRYQFMLKKTQQELEQCKEVVKGLRETVEGLKADVTELQ